MIQDNVKLHDKFSLEVKLGYKAAEPTRNEYAVHMWFYVPHSLDINKYNYPKQSFYRDLKSNLRLITPAYTLQQIASEDQMLFKNLKQISHQRQLNTEYHVRMFASILKSALRYELKHLTSVKKQTARTGVDDYVNNIIAITRSYRDIMKKCCSEKHSDDPVSSDELANAFTFGDEFISNIIEQHTFKLIDIMGKKGLLQDAEAVKLMELVKNEIAYKKEQGYPIVEINSKSRNRELVSRLGLLKKYIESGLFLDIEKQRDGLLAEQFYYSLAAGIAMLFATAIAFFFQKQYGELTTPFFIALIISYMMKDRLKDLARYLLANRWGRRFFDVKTSISMQDEKIGWQKEGMDFVPERKVPAAVKKTRRRTAIVEAENRFYAEKIILYRKLIRLDRQKLEKISTYPVEGINSIIRFNIESFLQKMDNTVFPLYVPGKGNQVAKEHGEKIYHINLIMRYRYNKDNAVYKHFIIAFNRNGISEVIRMKPISVADRLNPSGHQST